MFFPVSHTQPTELIFAHIASHMVAPLVLLDWSLAFWAILRIGNHPRDVFAFAFVFHIPLYGQLTTARAVGILVSFESEKISSLSFYLRKRVRNIFYSVSSPWRRTPLDILGIICIGFAVELYVFCLIISF
jgi:hypothetical protein